MALRQIREYGDPILEKQCKPVAEMTERTKELIDDMFETMYESGGVGLAAPQVGILKQLCVIDVTPDCSEPLVFINPEITEMSQEEQTGYEGCLSYPGKSGIVTRAMRVKATALDRDMKPFEIEAEGLLARCIQHEFDHLKGILYMGKVEGDIIDNSELYAEDDEEKSEDE